MVTGDREWDDDRVIDWLLMGLYDYNVDGSDFRVIHGGARGADNLAKIWARYTDSTEFSEIRDWEFPALWDKYGKAAGPIRNQQMLDDAKPELVLAFHDNLALSKGTADMVDRAKKAGIPVYLVSRP